MVGRLVASLAANVLAGAGFDSVLARLGLTDKQPAESRRPSTIAGYLILVAVMLFASIEAARLLGFEALESLVGGFTVFGGQVILGLIVFGIGLFLANVAAETVRSSRAPQAGLLAIAARVHPIESS
jgi:hypothetical protein